MFIDTFANRALARVGVLVLGITVVVSAPAQAQAQADRWQPFVGCWRPMDIPAGAPTAPSTLCIVPKVGVDGVDMVTTGQAATGDRTAVIADGQQHELSTGSCTGWQEAEWSQSGRVVYLHSEFSCDNGASRRTTGLLSIVGASQWVEVQTVSSGNAKDVRVARYETNWDLAGVSPEIARTVEAQQVASGTSRLSTSEALSIAEIADATKHVDGATVEAWVVEVGARSDIHVDAKALAELSKGGVSAPVIDLLVAMSYPDVFRLEHGAVAMVEAERAARSSREPDLSDFVGMSRGAYSGYDTMGFDPYYDPFFTGYYSSSAYRLYGSRAYGPNGSRYYMDYSPTIVVIREGGSGATVLPQAAEPARGKVVNGRGYSAPAGSGGGNGSSNPRPSRDVNSDNSSSGSSSGSSSTSSSSGDSGSGGGSAASPSGYSSGGDSEPTQRTAKPRGT